MNVSDRKVLDEVQGLLENAKEQMEILQEELEERAGNLPENFTEKIERLETEASEICDAISDIESALDHIVSAMEE